MKSRPLAAAVLLSMTGCGLLFGDDLDVRLATRPDADGGSTTVKPPVPPNPDGTCAADRKKCADLCVSLLDPAYGCAAETCEPCAGAQASCVAGACSGGPACSGSCNGPTPDGGTNPIALDVNDGRRTLSVGGNTGKATACGVKLDGSIACWGNAADGMLVPPTGVHASLEIDVFGCAVTAASTVACWGSVNAGTTPAPMPSSGTFQAVSVGAAHACGIESDGTLACWGSDGNGRATPPGGTFRMLSVGYAFACAIRDTGALACWGLDSRGTVSKAPSGTFSAVSANSYHACAIRSTDASVVCWGDDLSVPDALVPPSGAFLAVSAGEENTCGLRADRTIVCWGDNTFGTNTVPAGTFRTVVTNRGAVCATQLDGTVVCWGNIDAAPQGLVVK